MARQQLHLSKVGFDKLQKAKGPVLIEWKDVLDPEVSKAQSATRRAISETMKGNVKIAETQFQLGEIDTRSMAAPRPIIGRITEKTQQGIRVTRQEQSSTGVRITVRG